MKSVQLSLILFILFGMVTVVSGQTEPRNPGNDFDQPRPNRQFSLLRELGLDQNQIQKIRGINQQLRPRRQAAQSRLQQAKRTLDLSIYSDNMDKSTIQTNLQNVIEAQRELIKLKAEQELAVRSVLTPDQLVKFREIRNQFEIRKKRREMRRNRMMKRRRMKPKPNL